MYIKTLTLQNFKGFDNIELDFHPNLSVIVGANGSGKTSVMEGAAIALSAMFVKMDGLSGRRIDKSQAHLKAFELGSTKDVQPQYPVTVKASAVLNSGSIEWSRSLNKSTGSTTVGDAKEMIELGIRFQEHLRRGDKELILPVIAYYGTGRLWDYHREKQSDVFESNNRINGYVDCVDGTANIKLMINWFLKMTVQKYQNDELCLDDPPELEAVYSAMETCYRTITGHDDVKVQYNMGTKELEIAYRDGSGKLMRIPVNQLSDGYKSTISLVADIAYRMAVLNPQLLGDVCNETDGIVLIDEVDLHLHPKWQQRILGDLTEIFPKVQFIISTHAPEVINSVSKENVIVLENNQAVSAPAETYGKDANGILRTIMHVKERPNEIMQKFDDFYDLLNKGKYIEAGEVLDDLENVLGEDPALASMRIQLDLEQL